MATTAPAVAPARPLPTPVATSTATRDARIFTKDGATWQITLAGKSHAIRRMRGEAIETSSTSFTGGAPRGGTPSARFTEQLADGWTEIPDDGEPT